MRKRLGDDVFAAWFAGSKLVNVLGGTVTISVSTSFKRSRIVANYEADCLAAFSASSPVPINRVDIIFDGARR